jgi:gluconolactonase
VKLRESRVFAEITPGIPDGLRVDVEGNVWISAADGVQCHTRDGELIGKIRTPEVVANLAFGGARNNRLFITATTTVFAVFLNVRGTSYPFSPLRRPCSPGFTPDIRPVVSVPT